MVSGGKIGSIRAVSASPFASTTSSDVNSGTFFTLSFKRIKKLCDVKTQNISYIFRTIFTLVYVTFVTPLKKINNANWQPFFKEH